MVKLVMSFILIISQIYTNISVGQIQSQNYKDIFPLLEWQAEFLVSSGYSIMPKELKAEGINIIDGKECYTFSRDVESIMNAHKTYRILDVQEEALPLMETYYVDKYSGRIIVSICENLLERVT